MRRFVSFGPGMVVLLAVAVVVIAAPATIRQIDAARIAASVLQAQGRLDGSSSLEQANASVRDIAQAVLPCVVHIRAESNRFDRGTRAWGAGWVLDGRGHIVTNAHVVDGADTIRVELYDGRIREAELVGSDEHTDVAIIRVDAPGLVPIRRASGQGVHIGDKVFAFGSPFGIKFSMSEGIVSGLGRSDDRIRGSSGYTNYIQTDAAINPGNSGGPLVDVNGRLVAMNTAIANANDDPRVQGQSAGIGFAIPLETIEAITDQIADHELILRGYLGIVLDKWHNELHRPTARELDVDFDGAGVLVLNAPDDGPAGKAGLLRGDVIVGIDGHETPTSDVLRSLVSIRKPGQVVAAEVFRDGSYETIDVQLGGAYHVIERQNGRSILNLRYIPGSETMTENQIRRWIDQNSDDE